MSREKMASTGILGNLNLKTPGIHTHYRSTWNI